ncbi:hypothetical protein pb186bvf_019179 [Paramecium bursaria]
MQEFNRLFTIIFTHGVQKSNHQTYEKFREKHQIIQRTEHPQTNTDILTVSILAFTTDLIIINYKQIQVLRRANTTQQLNIYCETEAILISSSGQLTIFPAYNNKNTSLRILFKILNFYDCDAIYPYNQSKKLY